MLRMGELRAAGVLSDLDFHFATAVGRIAGEARADVLVAAALASRQLARGHVCLDLRRLVSTPLTSDDDGEAVIAAEWPDAEAWCRLLRTSPLISDGTRFTPLVLDDAGRLYLRRYWQHEAEVAAALRARAAFAGEDVDSRWLATALPALFPASHSDVGQRLTAVLALYRRLCVISGGPGTGKTFTVVKILALLIEHWLHLNQRVPRIILLAPTGKAAARLSEAIRASKQGLNCAPAVVAAVPEDAATIHRCLGPIGGSDTEFRHHADNPLVADVVVVDEASMVDVALLSRLLAAVPATARLILLGDKDQLASVEAGAILGDICNPDRPHAYSHPLLQAIASATGERRPQPSSSPAATGIWDCIVQLTHSYRYRSDSGIGRLADAINAGNSAAALAILQSPEYPDARLVDALDATAHAQLRIEAPRRFGWYLSGEDALARLRRLDAFRILCAHRHGPSGVAQVNEQVEAALAAAGLIVGGEPTYAGRPVLITQNDYQLALFNGDVGLIADSSSASGARVACFLRSDGQLRELSPARLPPHETVYAMTIHKSQGSEFDEVAVVLPERLSPVLTRELLYTAVTRARRGVTIYARPEIIGACIERRIERASGLRDRLWGVTAAGIDGTT